MYKNVKLKSIDSIEASIDDLKCFVTEQLSKNNNKISQEILLANEKIKTLEWVLGVR
jgi:hypothetical protein